MKDWFYTDAEATQQGPVDHSVLLDLNREGAIDARTLVWCDSMDSWQPFGAVAQEVFAEGGDGSPVEIGTCAHSHRVYPVEEMMTYGDAKVAIEHKEAFFQRLLESGDTEVSVVASGGMRYVGFWWRTLAMFLDYLILTVPSTLLMIPYFVVIAMSGIEDGGGDPSSGTLIAMGVSYGFGLIGITALSIFYETWMVGKYQGTLGKVITGSKVVRPDGSRLTYKRAFGRWLAKIVLSNFIISVVSTLGFVAVLALVFGLSESRDIDENSAEFVLVIFASFFACAIFGLASGAVYWMAAFDSEKRALHDRISATRVVAR